MSRYFGSPPLVLYQALFNGSADGSLYAIGAASSNGGSTWTQHVSNPVIQVGAGGSWEDATVKDPCLVWDGSQYVCYYSGFNGSNYRIGRATATVYTGPWTKYGSNPIISLGTTGTFRDAGVRFPTVLYEPSDTGKEWKMWFGADKTGAAPSVGYAHSTDGLSWTVVGQVLTVGAGGQWDDEGIYPFGIIKQGATYYLFYGGYQSASPPYKWQGGYASFTDPEGTYTKGGGNPTLLADFNVAASSQSLTSNTSAGSAVVHVGDTSNWVEGQPMVIAANNVVTEEHTIASIDSGTQVTLNANCSSSFNTANGAVLRPFAYNSIVPRSVLAVPGGGSYVMYCSPFQPVDDLTVVGETVWEGSMRATASALTGAWTLDNASGLLFPLSPANTGWNKFSSENPSVIVAP